MDTKVTVEPAGGTGWWIITYRDGIPNKQAVTYQELIDLYVALKDMKLPLSNS